MRKLLALGVAVFAAAYVLAIFGFVTIGSNLYNLDDDIYFHE